MKKFILIGATCAGLASLLPNVAHAQTHFGGTDCGKWIQGSVNTQKAWLLGYMSGMNKVFYLLSTPTRDPLDKVASAEQMYLWMDNYCKANPLSHIREGAFILFMEITKK